jgi:hypothetical protein
LGAGLPNVQVHDLEYLPKLNTLAAATSGRGLFEITIPVGTTIVVTGAGPGGGPQVSVFDGRSGLFEYAFYAYEHSYTGGVRVAVGDINGDGVPDIITAPGPGHTPELKVFDSRTGALIRDFLAYSSSFLNGFYVAAGDVNGDGIDDIITGAGPGGGPEVKVFDGRTNAVIYDFYAYNSAFGGGVRVASADINGDGKSDIITGAGPGGGPHVEVWSGADRSLLMSFYAYSKFFTGGVFVGGGYFTGSGLADVITGAGAGGGPQVEVWDHNTTLLRSFYAYSPSFSGGVRVALGDVNGDGVADIVTGPGPGSQPELIVRDAVSNSKFADFDAYSPQFPGGVFVATPAPRPFGQQGARAAIDRAATSMAPHILGSIPVTPAKTLSLSHPMVDLFHTVTISSVVWPANATLSAPARRGDETLLSTIAYSTSLVLGMGLNAETSDNFDLSLLHQDVSQRPVDEFYEQLASMASGVLLGDR